MGDGRHAVPVNDPEWANDPEDQWGVIIVGDHILLAVSNVEQRLRSDQARHLAAVLVAAAERFERRQQERR